MNKDILKQIKAELKNEMKALGFKTQGAWYFRVVNLQILQIINFQGSSSGEEFYLNIGVEPLCRKIENPNHCLPLCRIYGRNGDRRWEYSEEYVEKVVQRIREYVLPLFEQCFDYDSLFEAVKPQIGNFTLQQRESFKRDTAYMLYYNRDTLSWLKLLIRLQKYEESKTLLQNSIDNKKEFLENSERKYKELARNPEENFWDEAHQKSVEEAYASNRKTCMEWIEKMQRCLKKVETRDISDWMKEIEENEKRSLECLKKYIWVGSKL